MTSTLTIWSGAMPLAMAGSVITPSTTIKPSKVRLRADGLADGLPPSVTTVSASICRFMPTGASPGWRVAMRTWLPPVVVFITFTLAMLSDGIAFATSLAVTTPLT